jgi:hypothetical protein
MRILRIATLCACALLLVADFSAAQQIIINGATTDMPVQMPGMGPRQPKTGTARLRGRVLSVENGGPVRRAQVRILSPDIGSKTAMTDAEGRYEFRELPAGRFNLSANKAGYVTVQYGQTRPFESGKPIDLGDGKYSTRPTSRCRAAARSPGVWSTSSATRSQTPSSTRCDRSGPADADGFSRPGARR